MPAIKIIIGTLLGAGVGALLARSSACSGEACSIRNRRIPSILAGALFGAAVGYWWAFG